MHIIFFIFVNLEWQKKKQTLMYKNAIKRKRARIFNPGTTYKNKWIVLNI